MEPQVLGARIRQARERIGMTQDDLAVAVSKDQRAISEYENGKRKLAVIELPLFADALNIPVLFFFEGETGLEDLDRVLLETFHQISSSESRQAIIDVVRIVSRMLGQATSQS